MGTGVEDKELARANVDRRTSGPPDDRGPALSRIIARLLAAVLLSGGIIVAGAAAFVLILDWLVTSPVSLHEMVLLPGAGTTVGVGAAAAVAAGLGLKRYEPPTFWRAVAVGVGVVCAAMALVGAVALAAWWQ